MVGAQLTNIKLDTLIDYKPTNATSTSLTGVRILQGKLPVKEMQVLTRNRITDLDTNTEFTTSVYNDTLTQ